LSDYVSKSTRQAVRTARNRAARAGLTIDVRWRQAWTDVEPMLPRILDIRRQRDEQLDRPAEPPWKAAFWRRVIELHASTGELEVATLDLDGELAAYIVAFLDGPTYRIWDTRFSPNFAFYSPGRVLAFEALRRAITMPRFTEVDWMRGDDPYKRLLTNSRTEYSRIELANPRWLQRVIPILSKIEQARPSHSSGSLAP
jgi:CelD/BcsL family acetyltransferase involved in cellulose biosynthesis